ncbi:MAG: hypothetical protein BroJett003_00920 [Planctomycetota bacterium]|nr:MAG: hypothetical protein BroJett003_00920 [Planctomycetota bacterium]
MSGKSLVAAAALVVLTASIGWVETFRAGNALSFAGAGQLAVVPDTGLGTFGSSWAVECWLNPADLESPQRIVGKWGSAAEHREFVLEISGGQLRGRAAGSGGEAEVSVAAKSLVAGKWRHIALLLDDATGELRLYINAQLRAQRATAVTLDRDGEAPLVFGADIADQGASAFLKGELDEVRIWDRALTEKELLDRYDRQVRYGDAGLLGYWRLDEPQGAQELLDFSGHDRHGFLGGNFDDTDGDPARVTSTAPIRSNAPDRPPNQGGGGRKIAPLDSDGDRLWDIFETNDGDFRGPWRTGTDPLNADTDGDGLDDGDEVLGTLAGLDLPRLGANPVRKDIFLEIDWTDDSSGGMHSHRPRPESIDMIVEAFANAPVANPYALPPGISLHVDYGQGDPYIGGNFLGLDLQVTFDDEFNVYKAANFDPRREDLFHYAIFCHQFNANRNSGIAELPGDDFIVASDTWYDVSLRVATVCMHELGHNLGLRHGGNEERTYKPNYNSVMNYRYAFPGTDTNCDAIGDGGVNYSDGSLADLDETFLDEGVGICGDVPVDWNGDGRFRRNFSRNINCIARLSSVCGDDGGVCDDRLCTTLRDFNDWAAIRLPIPPGDAPFSGEITDCRMQPED